MIAERLRTHRGYQAIQQLPGVGPVLAAVFVAEVGDVHRFKDPAHLCAWAGLTPTHRESDTVVRRGHITKQGSKLVRWAAVEAIQRQPDSTKIARDRKRIEDRRGRNIAKVGCGPQTAHPRLLRAARRTHPRAGPPQQREHLGRNARGRAIVSPPYPGAVAD